MKSLNEVKLIGHVGQTPEIKVFESGNSLSVFSIATNQSYVKDGQKIDNTTWHRIVAWRKLAEIIEKYVNKGDKVYISGRLNNRQYEDDSGVKRHITEIVAKDLIMLGSPRKKDESTSHAGDDFRSLTEPEHQQEDDLPF